MRKFYCDGCEGELTDNSMNTVRVQNRFNHEYELHYCAACALKLFPQLKSMIGWTKHG